MAPFSHLFGGFSFKHLYGRRIPASAQAGIKCNYVGAIFPGTLIPAHLTCSKNRLVTLQIQQLGRSNQGFVIDNKFASHLSTESIFAQLCPLFSGPGFISVRVFVPVTSIGLESIYAQFCGIAIGIFATVCTFPQQCKLIFVTVWCACYNRFTTSGQGRADTGPKFFGYTRTHKCEFVGV